MVTFKEHLQFYATHCEATYRETFHDRFAFLRLHSLDKISKISLSLLIVILPCG